MKRHMQIHVKSSQEDEPEDGSPERERLADQSVMTIAANLVASLAPDITTSSIADDINNNSIENSSEVS